MNQCDYTWTAGVGRDRETNHLCRIIGEHSVHRCSGCNEETPQGGLFEDDRKARLQFVHDELGRLSWHAEALSQRIAVVLRDVEELMKP